MEGRSGGQGEQKIYKALGQIIAVISQLCENPKRLVKYEGYTVNFYVVVSKDLKDRLHELGKAAGRLGVRGLWISTEGQKCEEVFPSLSKQPLLPLRFSDGSSFR